LEESGFSLSPIRGTTWAEGGKPVVLRSTYSRHTQTGFGFITMSPKQRRLNFRFTIFDGAITMVDLKMFLTQIHRYYGGKVLIHWDRLPAHIATQSYFEQERSDWFLFEYFPSYSPELNPVEQCWNQMKNVWMANFISMSIEHLKEKTMEVAKRLDNDPKLLAEFFHHAKLNL
jgi:hypothetical protein